MQKSTIIIKIETILIAIYSIIIFTPYIWRRLNIYIGIAVIASIAFCMILKNRKKISYITLLIIIWSSILGIYVFVQMPNFSIGNYLYYILYFFPMIMYIYFAENKMNFSNNIKKIINIIFLILIITNIFILKENPYATKEVTGGYGNSKYLYNTNIISDIYAFSVVLYTYYILLNIHFQTNKKKKIIEIIILVFSLYMIISTTFFISIIAMIIIILLNYMLYSTRILKYTYTACIVIGLIIIMAFSSAISNKIVERAKKIENYVIRERIISIINLVNNKQDDKNSSMNARFNDISISLKTFTNNYLVGRGFLVSNDIQSTGIGMHSHFIDDLARFGILGFSIEIIIYFLFFKYVLEKLCDPYKNAYIVVICAFCFYGLFNPCVYPQNGLMLFFIFPNIINNIQKMKTERKE